MYRQKPYSISSLFLCGAGPKGLEADTPGVVLLNSSREATRVDEVWTIDEGLNLDSDKLAVVFEHTSNGLRFRIIFEYMSRNLLSRWTISLR